MKKYYVKDDLMVSVHSTSLVDISSALSGAVEVSFKEYVKLKIEAKKAKAIKVKDTVVEKFGKIKGVLKE